MHAQDFTTAAPARRRILLVDDHLLVRRGLTALIDNEPDLVVCAAVATQREGLAAITEFSPDLVITDVSLGAEDGLAMVQDIHAGDAGLPVLVLTVDNTPAGAERAFRAGASGYVSKQEMGESLLGAIHCVLGGERYLSPKIRAALGDT